MYQSQHQYKAVRVIISKQISESTPLKDTQIILTRELTRQSTSSGIFAFTQMRVINSTQISESQPQYKDVGDITSKQISE